MWPLYVLIILAVVLLYFIARIEWVYHKYERFIRDEGLDVYKADYPPWERALYRYFYIWRFASLKGKN